jgi:ribosome-associated translation inhibitor RaiA
LAKQDFHIEMKSELQAEAEMQLFTEAEDRLQQLAEGHDDLIGAAVSIEEPARGENTYLYEATVVAYTRPNNIAGTEKAEQPIQALRGALDAVERQVREKREKLRQRWEQPGNKPPEQRLEEKAAAQLAVEEELEDEDEEADTQ